MREKSTTAWVEVRDAAGVVLKSVPATIERGAVSARLPAFTQRQVGTIQVCTRSDGAVRRDRARLEVLPDEPLTILQLIG